MSIKFSHFLRYPSLKYGFSTRHDGPTSRNTQLENRARYFRKMEIDPGQVVTADLVHGSEVVVAGKELGGKMVKDTDGLVTNTPSLFLSVTSADCFPVYFCGDLQ